jgi:hypothetical protein
MVMQIIEEITDDVDGGPATTSKRFTVDGVTYLIDLNDANTAKFDAQMQFWIDRARLASAESRAGNPSARPPARPKKPTNTDLNKRIRDWWRDNASLVRLRTRREFSEYGRIPDDIREMFAAH